MAGMTDHSAAGSRRFTVLVILFELALGVAALLLGALIGPWPAATLVHPPGLGPGLALLVGSAVALPLFVVIMVIDRQPIGILQNLQRIVREQIVPLFRHTRPIDLLLISLSAGVGEELLFRGYVQTALSQWLALPGADWVAVIVAAALFGLCHWLCLAYAILAFAMGLLLGGLFAVTGNLLAPMATHSLYDFLALLYLVRCPLPAG